MKLWLLIFALIFVSGCSVVEPVEDTLFQTVYNYSGIRTEDVTYTNNTGKPLALTVTLRSNNHSCPYELRIDGVLIMTVYPFYDALMTGIEVPQTLTFIIPNGSTYKWSKISAGQISVWIEVY